MKRDVFISYSRKNMERVKEIKGLIDTQCGTDCWIDLKGIESGSEMFLRDIVGGIDACKVFLFMLSRESMESEYALKELKYAKMTEKRVVLVNIDGCKMTGVFLFEYSLTDTIAWNDQSQREKLLRDVSRWVGDNKTEPPITLPPKDQQQDIVYLRPIYDSKKNKYGFEDIFHNVVIPCRWNDAYWFNDGLARVKDSNNMYGYIDKTGRLITPCKWKEAYDFSNGSARVMDKKGRRWKIDKAGTVIDGPF